MDIYVYIVVADNCEYYEDYEEDILKVCSSKEEAKAIKPIVGWQINRIEQWELDGVCVDGNILEEDEDE